MRPLALEDLRPEPVGLLGGFLSGLAFAAINLRVGPQDGLVEALRPRGGLAAFVNANAGL